LGLGKHYPSMYKYFPPVLFSLYIMQKKNMKKEGIVNSWCCQSQRLKEPFNRLLIYVSFITTKAILQLTTEAWGLKRDIIWNTCVSAFLEIHQKKIFQYNFLGQYPIKFWDFLSLCKIQQPAWQQLDQKSWDHQKLDFHTPISRDWKNTLSCEIYVYLYLQTF